MSYNSLFGLGSHSEDANLEGWWPLQDDAADTVVDDVSSNANDGVLQGGDNTSDLSTTGPNNWLTKALNVDGSADYISNGTVASNVSAFTICARVYRDAASQLRDDTVFGSASGVYFRLGRSSGLFDGSFSETEDTNPGGTSQATWHDVIFLYDGSDLYYFLDGSQVGTEDAAVSQTPDLIAYIGGLGGATQVFDGRICDVPAFSRAITSAERGQWRLGPELNYVSGASIDEDGNYDAGTHALPSPFASGSNGTPAYDIVVANAAGSVIDSVSDASGTTGTFDISAEAGNTVYFLVRAKNTGGYDIGDKATRTSSYGSSGDGYYELASVTAAGGGGGATRLNLMTLLGVGA